MSRQQRDALDQLLWDGPLDIGGDVDIQRPLFETMAGALPLPDDVAVTQRVLGGIPVIDIEIAAVHTTDVIVYLHGGGYALGSATRFAKTLTEPGNDSPNTNPSPPNSIRRGSHRGCGRAPCGLTPETPQRSLQQPKRWH